MPDGYRTIIAGSRTLGITEVRVAMACVSWIVGEVICGCADGTDQAGWKWERDTFPGRFGVHYFPAWPRQRGWAFSTRKGTETITYPPLGYNRGKGNGFARNLAMAEYVADGALVVAWDGSSHGTRNMIDIAKQRGLKMLIWTPAGVIE